MPAPELGRRLQALAPSIDYPPTPQVAASVAKALRGDEVLRKAPIRLRFQRALALVMATTLVTTGAVIAAVPDVRQAFLDLIDLRGATIETTTAPAPPPPAEPPGLGRETSLSAARAELGFDPVLPSQMGAPDRVFVRTGIPGGEFAALYGTIILTEFRGDLLPEYVAKVVPAATDVDRLRVGGHEAVWISGAPHFFGYRLDGEVRENDLRVAANVLVIERGRLLVRIEGSLPRSQALEIGRSLR